MKYMIEYEIRTTGLSHEQNLASQDALLVKAFSKWKPEEGLTVHAFLSHSNHGGCVLAGAAEPGVVLSFVSKFNYWNDVQVVPVADVTEAVTAATESLAWAGAALSD
jgi:hypothetical protein